MPEIKISYAIINDFDPGCLIFPQQNQHQSVKASTKFRKALTPLYRANTVSLKSGDSANTAIIPEQSEPHNRITPRPKAH